MLGIVGGAGTVVVVGGGSVVVVVDVGGGSVVVVVAGGGDVVAGTVVAAVIGVGVNTLAWVVTGPAVTGPTAGAVVDVGSVEDVDVAGAAGAVVGAATVVMVGRGVVEGDWLATCCLGEVSAPVATSNSMAASAIAASR